MNNSTGFKGPFSYGLLDKLAMSYYLVSDFFNSL